MAAATYCHPTTPHPLMFAPGHGQKNGHDRPQPDKPASGLPGRRPLWASATRRERRRRRPCSFAKARFNEKICGQISRCISLKRAFAKSCPFFWPRPVRPPGGPRRRHDAPAPRPPGLRRTSRPGMWPRGEPGGSSDRRMAHPPSLFWPPLRRPRPNAPVATPRRPSIVARPTRRRCVIRVWLRGGKQGVVLYARAPIVGGGRALPRLVPFGALVCAFFGGGAGLRR